MPTKNAPLKDLFERGLIWFADPSANSPLDSETLQQFSTKQLATTHTAIQNSPTPLPLHRNASGVPFGVPEIDNQLHGLGLLSGALHEFFYQPGRANQKRLSQENATTSADKSINTATPSPICTLPAILAVNAWRKKGAQSCLVWIGKGCWPTPFLLRQIAGQDSAALLNNCLFTDPANKSLKLWALETALRSSGVAAVVAECETIRFALSQRFALAAEHGDSLGLLIRPAKDKATPSAALTRWRVSPKVLKASTANYSAVNSLVRQSAPLNSSQDQELAQRSPAWELELLKSKGKQPLTTHWSVAAYDNNTDRSSTNIEAPKQTLSLHLFADLVGRSGAGAEEHANASKNTDAQKYDSLKYSGGRRA